MKISNNNQYTSRPQNTVPFEALNFKKIANNINMFEDFPIKLKSGNLTQDCFVRASSDSEHFYIDVENATGKHLGMSTSTALREKGTLYNNLIQNFRKEPQVQGVGSTMRLGQIIVLLENKKLNKIKLFSMGDAVFFQSKFKFKPAISESSELEGKLNEILMHSGDDRFSENIKEVKTFLAKNRPIKKSKLKDGNELLDKYLQNVIKYNLHNDVKFKIYSGFDMELSKKDVLENKDFYNSLFKKYNIDYQINT